MGMGGPCSTPGCRHMHGHPDDCAPGVPSPGYARAAPPTVRPRGHEPVSGRRTFSLSQIRVAAGCAIAEGKALVTCDGGVITLAFHPLSRIAPNVEGDGFALADDDATTSALLISTDLVVGKE